MGCGARRGQPGTSCCPPSTSYVAPVSAVLVIRWIASSATSAGPTTRPMGSESPQLVAAGIELVAEQRRRQRSVDEAGGDQVHPDRRDLDRQVGGQRGECRRCGPDHGHPDARTTPAGAAHEDKRPAGPDPGRGVAGHGEHHHRVLVEPASCVVEVHVGQRRVVGPAGGHHHVVDRLEPVEEGLEVTEVVGVEGGRADRPDLGGGALQPLGSPAGEDHVGALGPRGPRRLQPDAGAASDHDHRLPEQSRVASTHVGAAAPTFARPAATCAVSALSAPT